MFCSVPVRAACDFSLMRRACSGLMTTVAGPSKASFPERAALIVLPDGRLILAVAFSTEVTSTFRRLVSPIKSATNRSAG